MSRPPEVSWRELRGVQLDPSLSLAAKGLLHGLLLRPSGAVLTRVELFETNSDPMAAIDNAIEELARAGLVVKVPPRKRSQDRRSGGVKLPAPAVHQPQPEPNSGAVFGARPAPAWWDVWQVPVTDVTVLRPFKGQASSARGGGEARRGP
jgi:hypothetical protein